MGTLMGGELADVSMVDAHRHARTRVGQVVISGLSPDRTGSI